MKLLRTVENVHEEQIVQKKVLDEIVLVESLLVGRDQRLHLKRSHLRGHVDIIGTSVRNQDILQLLLIHDLKELIAGYHLALCRRIHEADRRLAEILCVFKRRRSHKSFRINHTHVNPADQLQPVQSRLKHLI